MGAMRWVSKIQKPIFEDVASIRVQNQVSNMKFDLKYNNQTIVLLKKS
jgi:hypothetical protein